MDNNNNFGISESELMNAALGDFDDAPAKPESKDIFSSSTPAASPAGAFANNAPNAGVNPPANGQGVTKPINPAPAGYRPAPPANGQNFGAPVNPVQANRGAQGQAAPVAKPVQNAANPVNPAPAGYRPAPPVSGQNFGAPVNPAPANRSAQGQAAPVAKPVQNAANPVNPAPAGYRPAPPVNGQKFGAANPVQANRPVQGQRPGPVSAPPQGYAPYTLNNKSSSGGVLAMCIIEIVAFFLMGISLYLDFVTIDYWFDTESSSLIEIITWLARFDEDMYLYLIIPIGLSILFFVTALVSIIPVIHPEKKHLMIMQIVVSLIALGALGTAVILGTNTGDDFLDMLAEGMLSPAFGMILYVLMAIIALVLAIIITIVSGKNKAPVAYAGPRPVSAPGPGPAQGPNSVPGPGSAPAPGPNPNSYNNPANNNMQ
ncbi:MAG: hypothetical protein II702_08045 [Clostridia bacterium]|nr:hypothetical protein [Clostridia bacterium]